MKLSRQERRQLKASLRQQRKEAKARLKTQLEEVKKLPAVQDAMLKKRRKRQRQLAALLAILLALLFLDLDCNCDPQPGPPPPPVEVDPPEVEKKPKPPPRRRRKRARLDGKIRGQDRDPMKVETPAGPPWLGQFRMQVAARGPLLAACFVGQEKPGALRFSALVNAKSGRIFEPVVEPVFRGVSLVQSQQACIIDVLTDKPYKLDEPNPEASPRRVSLIFEF